MPIRDVHFKNGIFFCREVGRIDDDDARLWTTYAEKFAALSDLPIVALVDATQTTRITAAARKIFAEASAIPNLQHGIVAATDFRVAQSARLTAMLARDKHTEVFDSMTEARAYAEQCALTIRESREARCG